METLMKTLILILNLKYSSCVFFMKGLQKDLPVVAGMKQSRCTQLFEPQLTV